MTVVLGLDPAWTANNPSGVALLKQRGAQWHCVGLAPSYRQFLELARGERVDWSSPHHGDAPSPLRLIDASRRLGGSDLDLVVADMPLANEPISTRRLADAEISRRFGARGCSTHSPTFVRPGSISDQFSAQFREHGFTLATRSTPVGERGHFLEAYPHPALLSLLPQRNFRIPYKLARAARYWPALEPLTPSERKVRVLAEWRGIRAALRNAIDGIDLPLPSPKKAPTLAMKELKGYEDAIDALICAWVGIQFLRGSCTAYGDDTASIWVPDRTDAA